VATVEDLVKSQQLLHREYFQPIEHPSVGTTLYPGVPFTFDGKRPDVVRAPLLGEHNVEIYCERLGYSKQELVHLFNSNAI
jgi:crotonobetainyl-CoA:carnitine CoA-transferase CaiB-like acyl-CoA transferase